MPSRRETTWCCQFGRAILAYIAAPTRQEFVFAVTARDSVRTECPFNTPAKLPANVEPLSRSSAASKSPWQEYCAAPQFVKRNRASVTPPEFVHPSNEMETGPATGRRMNKPAKTQTTARIRKHVPHAMANLALPQIVFIGLRPAWGSCGPPLALQAAPCREQQNGCCH